MGRSATDLALLAAALAAGTALAELLGAANMGTALTFGTLAFTALLLGMLLRPPSSAAQPRRGTASDSPG